MTIAVGSRRHLGIIRADCLIHRVIVDVDFADG
jgi:hypothetical protein